MHPKMHLWWSHGHRNCGPDDEYWERRRGHRGHHRGGSGFGVRRPLRYLARHLDLDERQTSAIAVAISNLKTERAQAEVDDRRALGRYADALGGDHLDAAAIVEAGQLRRDAVDRVEAAVARTLEQIHAVLDPEQREDLAMLIRTGGLRI